MPWASGCPRGKGEVGRMSEDEPPHCCILFVGGRRGRGGRRRGSKRCRRAGAPRKFPYDDGEMALLDTEPRATGRCVAWWCGGELRSRGTGQRGSTRRRQEENDLMVRRSRAGDPRKVRHDRRAPTPRPHARSPRPPPDIAAHRRISVGVRVIDAAPPIMVAIHHHFFQPPAGTTGTYL